MCKGCSKVLPATAANQPRLRAHVAGAGATFSNPYRRDWQRRPADPLISRTLSPSTSGGLFSSIPHADCAGLRKGLSESR